MTVPVVSEQTVKELVSFGLNGNEAKAYIALLRLKKAGAREIARVSNIPRQEIYRVLPALEKLGMIEVIIGKPTRFLAMGPDEVLSGLIERQEEISANRISELRQKKDIVKAELMKVEGKSAGLQQSEPVRFALISGQRLVNEKIQEMLDGAKKEVLWMVPNLEIKRAIIYDRDKMLRQCARRGVKVRIITEIDEKNAKDVKTLSAFCDVRHIHAVTSLITIVDETELIVSSAMHKGDGVYGTELIHKLWTNDSDHVNVMKDFFEKVWADSTPAKSKIETMKLKP